MREQLRADALRRFGAYARSDRNLDHLAQLHKRQTTHGLAKHPLYKAYRGMMARCHRADHPAYASYGGRGIQVYGPWHDVREFIGWVEEHLGPRPVGQTLDRIDNDGSYEPGNVRWADASVQQSNRRSVTVLQERIASLRRELDQLRGGEA
jgi:hypothetical protein